MGWLKQQELVSYSHGGCKVQDKVLAESVPSEGSLLACREQLSCYVLTQGGSSNLSSLVSSCKGTNPITLGVRTSVQEFGAGQKGEDKHSTYTMCNRILANEISGGSGKDFPH